jgi:hypothetical protein
VTPPFRVERSGRIETTLDDASWSILGTMPDYLAGLDGDRSDPAVARLYPPGHPDDEEAERRFRSLVTPGLRHARSKDLEAFVAVVAGRPDSLSAAEASVWLRVLGEARLAIAARAGVVGEAPDGWDEAEPESPEIALVHFLGYLQGSLAAALLGSGEWR